MTGRRLSILRNTSRALPAVPLRKSDFRVVKGAPMAKRLIVSDPSVMMGKPVVRGTRITVELILEKLGAGETNNFWKLIPS
jgi:hypothetical protein